MHAKVSLLVISLAIIALPWLLWRIGAVRRVAPLAVVQIMVGVALGPSCLARFAPELHRLVFTPAALGSLDGLATIGVVLYVFVTGLHLDPSMHRQSRGRLGAAALGSVAVPLVLGCAAGWWMLQIAPGAAGSRGGGVAFVAAVGICVAVTALPVLAAVLRELDMVGSRLGQTALALAALNDAALWIMLATLVVVAGEHGSSGLLGLAGSVLWFGVLIGVVRPLLARWQGAGEHALMLTGVSLAIVSAAVSEQLGTGYLIGAFTAGAIFPASCRPALLARLETFTAIVLLPFFFMSTGLKALIEPGSASFLGLLGIVVAATVLGKLTGTVWPARRLGFSWAESVSLGVMMQTKGLMEVVVLGVLLEAGLLGREIFSVMVAMAIVCTLLTTPLVRLLGRLETGVMRSVSGVRS